MVWCRKKHLDGTIELPPKEKSTIYHRMEIYQRRSFKPHKPGQAQAFLDTAAICRDYDDKL
jgi:hypothetical protein